MNTWIKSLIATAAISIATQAGAISVDVFAQANSSAGGMGAPVFALTAGQSFSVSSNPNDIWNAGPLPRWSNANGLVGPWYATGTDESGEAAGTQIGANFGVWTQGAFSAPYGAMVGQIGSGAFFLVGTSYTGTAANSGTLNLFYWDSNNQDNTDKITVQASNGVPDGGMTVGLLGGAFLGLAALRRKF